MARQKTRTQSRRRGSSPDPVTRYAREVVKGRIVAGPHVRDACARHLRDLKEGRKRGLRWDPDAVERVVAYFREVLRVDRTAADPPSEETTKPFELLDWQVFVIGSLFGWKGRDGFRRFRVAFVETGKGSGKSPLCAGTGLYMLTSDGENRAECYAAATIKDQARVLFRDAVSMVTQSPDLSARLVMSGGDEKNNIAFLPSGSFFKPISSEERGRGKSGPRPHFVALDEIHEHPTQAMVEFMRAGTKSRRQALVFMITNSGTDRESVCYAYHDYGIKVASGALEDDSFFSFICAGDEGDDPFADPACWPKTNPSLGATITEKYLEEQVRQARGMPSKQNLVRRLNFCQWTEAERAWITQAVWQKVERELALDDFLGERCFGGLDLSYTKDLSALGLVFPIDDKRFAAFAEFWKPEVGLLDAEELDGVPYDIWAKLGHLNLTEGKIIKLAPIAKRIGEVADLFDLQVLAFDRYRHKELDADMENLGVEVPMIEHPQGFRRAGKIKDARGELVDNPLWMPDSVQELENAIVEEHAAIAINPILRWNVASVAIRDDPAGTANRIFDKRKATGRIDGAVAVAMAVGAARRFASIGGKHESIADRIKRRGILEVEL